MAAARVVRRASVALALGLAGATLACLAAAQPPAARPGSLPDERDERIRRLEAENTALRQRVRDLQAQLDRQRPQGPEAEADAWPIDPFSSPGSLLAELRHRYATGLGDVGRATAAQRERFEALARRWCERTRSEVRGRTRWLAVVTDVRTPENAPADALVRVLDEFTHRPASEALRVVIGNSAAERIETLTREFARRHARTPVGEEPELAFELSGLVIASPLFNPERTEPGVFDIPPFVGPCVEFAARFEAELITPVELARRPPEPAAAPAPGAAAAQGAPAPAR